VVIRKCMEDLNTVKVPELMTTDASGEALPSEKIRAQGQELEKTAVAQTKILEGIQTYVQDKAKDAALKERLNTELREVYKRHNELMLKLNEFRKKLMEQVHTEVANARAKEVEKTAEERRAKEKDFEERRERILQQGNDLIEILEGVCNQMIEEPYENKSLEELQNNIKLMEKAEEETDKYFKEELEKAKRETISSGLMLDLITLQRKGRNNNTKTINAFAKMRQRLDDKRSAKRDDALEEIRKLMRKRHNCPGKVFDEICKDECFTHEQFLKEFTDLSAAATDVVKSMPWPLSRAQFQLAFFNLCTFKGTVPVDILTDVGMSIAVKSDAMMEVLREEGANVHVRVLTDDAFPEGAVAEKKVRKLALKYDIMKETVLTNKLELNQLKVLSRLKKGDKIFAVGLPVQSASLLRMEAKLEDGTIGWISMEGSGVDYIKPTVWE